MRRSVASRLVLLTGVASAALMAQHAAAQPAGRTIQLDPVVVEAEGDREAATGAVDGYVARRTLSGSKTATPLSEVPQSVSVIGRTEMDDQGVQKADEALRYTAGVFSQPFGSDSDTNWMYIRGFDATQTGAYLDGMQLYAYGFGAFYIDSYNLERVEVLKGASSALYGGANPGGLVNYVSKQPTGERIRKIELGLIDSGKVWVGFDIADALGTNSDGAAVDYRVSGRVEAGSGQTDFNDGWRGSVSPSLHWKINDATDLTILANYTHIDERHGGGVFLPYVGSVERAWFGRIDREANFTEPDIDTYERKQGSIGWAFRHVLDNDWEVRQNVRFGYADVHELYLYPFGYAGYTTTPGAGVSTLERVNFEHESKVTSFTADNQLEGTVTTGAIEHTLLTGFDYRLFYLDQVQMSGSATPISATDPHYGAVQGDRSPYLEQKLTQQQFGVYAQDQMRWENFILTLNGRYDYVKTDSSAQTFSGPVKIDDGQGAASGRIGLGYQFTNGLTPYASASTFFNPIIDTDASGSLFEPETGQQFEVGLKYEPTFIDGLFTVVLFDLTKQNVVAGVAPNRTQIGEVNSRGIEVEAKVNLDRNWRVSAAFTALDMEITKGDNEGNWPYLAPDKQASLWLEYGFHDGTLDGLSLGGGVRYVGASWGDPANALRVPEVALLDAHLGYERGNWGVDLNVSNLLDTEYVAGCQDAYTCGYGEGRAIKLKVSATW